MIIKRIHSENFLKYTSLDICDLPENGLITVSGANESGKTTLGETLCFALFGRTFTLKLDEPRKLIRWGASQCAVSVEFAAGADLKNYSVTRFLDDDGAYGARLESLDDDSLLTKGVENVDERMRTVLGFGYEEFIESFYLAQRELTTPHPHSHTIKVMAGIAPLAKTGAELEVAITDEQHLQQTTDVDYQRTVRQLDDLGIDDSWYPELLKTRETLQSESDQRLELNAGVQRSADDYQQTQPALQKQGKVKAFLLFTTIVLFFLSAILWSAWVLLEHKPDSSLAQMLAEWLSSNLDDWRRTLLPALLPAAIGTSVLLLLSGYKLTRAKRQIAFLRKSALRFGDQLGLVNQFVSANAAEFSERIKRLFVKDEHLAHQDLSAESLLGFERSAKALQLSPSQALEVSVNIDEALANELSCLETRMSAVREAVAVETHRLNQASSLRSIRDQLNIKIADHMHRIKVREKSVSLLDAASHHHSHRFNQSILRLAGDALPKFTQDRYRHLQIDENLEVRVFSNEKHDFMGFEEISAGTQRQIMLALRLAMSEELIHAIECGKQFIFFDEPFAFFDQDRIRETLNALPHFSDSIGQIWLVAQEFPENINVDRVIPCSRETTSLVLDH